MIFSIFGLVSSISTHRAESLFGNFPISVNNLDLMYRFRIHLAQIEFWLFRIRSTFVIMTAWADFIKHIKSNPSSFLGEPSVPKWSHVYFIIYEMDYSFLSISIGSLQVKLG